MSIPAAANVGLNLLLIPRLGLPGAMMATTASYGLGLAASIGLGRFAQPLPLPLGAVAKAALASAVMGVAVSRLPSLGGVAELGLKALAGAVVYGALAYVLDIAELRSKGRGAIGVLRARTAT